MPKMIVLLIVLVLSGCGSRRVATPLSWAELCRNSGGTPVIERPDPTSTIVTYTSDDPEAIELRRLSRLSPSQGGLRGADVVCCCAPLPCHGDVRVEYANG